MQQQAHQRKLNNYEKNIKNRSDLPISLLSFLFSEMVQYVLTKSNDGEDLSAEERLSCFGYSIGEKVLELVFLREKNYKRELKIIPMLQFINNNVWKMLFNKQADGLQKSTDDPHEYRIIENSPVFNKFIPLNKLNNFNCASFTAGIIEGFLNSADLRCKVSAALFEIDAVFKTYYIIKFDENVIDRDNEIK